MVTTKRKHADAVFKAIADPTRREILRLLRGEELTVGRLAANFRTSRPAISKHLRLLRSAGLVSTRKQGAASLCRLNAKPLEAVDKWLREYQAFWKQNLRNLKQLVEKNP
jgi:DNA-binding transcriptional ArsR family regulator